MIRIVSAECVFLTHQLESFPNSKIRLSVPSSHSTLTTLRMEHPAAFPAFGAEVGRMARDLAALFRISNVINSIRDAERLQRELLRLISEVVPADHGAVVLQTDLDEETNSICTWSRQPDVPPTIEIQRELVHRAIWERSAIFSNSAADSSDTHNVLCLPLVPAARTTDTLYLAS